MMRVHVLRSIGRLRTKTVAFSEYRGPARRKLLRKIEIHIHLHKGGYGIPIDSFRLP